VVAVCKRPYDEFVGSARQSLEKVILKVCGAVEDVLAKESSAELWNHYVTFLHGCVTAHKVVFEKDQSQFLVEKLTEVYKKISQTPHISEEIISEWIAEAVRRPTKDSSATAAEIASLGVLRYPMSQAMWLYKINLSLPSLASDSMSPEFLFFVFPHAHERACLFVFLIHRGREAL